MTPDTLQLCTKCNTMKYCTDGVCGRCAVPEPVKRMVDAFDEAFLPYDCETSNGHTCHLEKYRPKIKDFLTTHATTLYNDAVREGVKKQVDILIAVNEWLIQRGDMSAAKELNDAMCEKFGITPPTDNPTNV